MAKKKRKRRKPNLPQSVLDRAQAQAAGLPADKPKPRPPATTPAASTQAAVPEETQKQETATVDLAQEYKYVAADLQRIGLLSALVMIGLVVLKVLTG